ncbi:Aldo/keto reductase [Pseudovirgaria hyperparasitica]|uniref:Aldo/keto reductase n=1 Tax=Pseudovirgaria hyperparasitica TaxID=470096 RepID=A0A6A6VYA8_9PEZI|nr:Aldo/keto reductase [Pseudovirgaria hyperparasitica]KAF2755612.1 Aldo/keto reductase [Pseudovirgaria hyperparasitica]
MAKIYTPIPSLKLNDGTSMPMLGYGTGTAWFKSGDDTKVDRILIDTIKKAIEMGYTYLDGGEMYKTEAELGIAIQESGTDRSKLYVVAKVINNPLDVEGSLRASLKKLQLDYVDQYLIHHAWWTSSPADIQKSWAQMEAVQALGLTKSIGVSNFRPQDFEVLLRTAKVVPAINQIEFHPYLQHNALIELHKKHGVATSAYGPLTPIVKAAGGPVDEALARLAKKYAVSEGEVLLRWCIDQDIIPITTSSKEQRLSDYLRAATFKLNPSEIQSLKEIGENKHFRGFYTNKFEVNDRT